MKNKKASKTAAAVGAVIAFLFLCIGMLAFYIWVTNVTGITIIIPIVFAVIYAVPVTGLIMALIQRIKEIKGGEEDEASKY